MIMLVPLLERRIGAGRMLRNWGLVYLGNLVGSVLVAVLIFHSGQLGFSHGLLGGFTIKVAAYKTGLTFVQAFAMGILCNWLVCMAVWMAAASRDIVGKLFAIFFPIWLFITSGFEHSVANMYYIPAGLLAKTVPAFVEQAKALGATDAGLANLTWFRFAWTNLLPVTLGNLVGGGLFVGIVFWLAHVRKGKGEAT
jgi:formate/nitrite transporter